MKVILLCDRCFANFVVSRNLSFPSFSKLYSIGSVGFYTSVGLARLDQDRIHTERKQIQRKEKREQQGIKPPDVEEEETDDYCPGAY
jgi:hypothetical protein